MGEYGRPLVGSVDHETLCLLGSNLGIGVLAEAGVMEFGAFERAEEFLEEVGRGTPTGRALNSGSVVCGRVFGVEGASTRGRGFYQCTIDCPASSPPKRCRPRTPDSTSAPTGSWALRRS